MTPVCAVVSSPVVVDTYRFRVAQLEDLTPLLVATGLADVVYETEGTIEEMTLASSMTVRFDQTSDASPGTPSPEPLVLEHVFSGTNPAATLFKSVKDELAMLYDNRFSCPAVSSVDIKLRLTPGRNLSYLLSAQPDRVHVRPGETVGVVLQLRDHRGKDRQHSTTVTIPPTAREGSMTVLFCQPDSFLVQEAMRAPGHTTPGSLARLKEMLAESGRENELVVAAYTPSSGVTLAECEFADPPPGLRAVLLRNPGGRPALATSSSLVFKQRLRLDRAISGSARFELQIRR
jgi:hypothetical protein